MKWWSNLLSNGSPRPRNTMTLTILIGGQSFLIRKRSLGKALGRLWPTKNPGVKNPHEVLDLTALAARLLHLHRWPASVSPCRVSMGPLSASAAWAAACLQVTGTALQVLVFANSCV